ncbi:hypothetical protein [Candidatus Nitrosocosmicus franklandus]|uniref:Uncharacterized protein n=1 Tax=Candidatus Nitrosocosmicus franklandianus TaxID=1798806 RepID=A0A484IC73_9ARCH|nr:hypothetical protein [Candidatus Nitrosocosmicus franklandus]VFJ12621.1 conserved protein of unknown function [Candidatus Nitrosocosmicus franklandus]
MTICIGAISKNDDKTKESAVVVSDRMVTVGLPPIEFEQKLSKSIQITQNCVVSIAGSALAFSDILNDVRSNLSEGQNYSISQIAETIRNSYTRIRNKKIEEVILSGIGMSSIREFFERNMTLSQSIVNNVFDAFSRYNYGLVILVTGTDINGAHVLRIDNPGTILSYDSIGYCAIGIGEIHAMSTFIANDYYPYLDLNHVVALSYEAKKRSEKAQGVGQQSDLFIIKDGKSTKLTDEQITNLNNIYDARADQEKKAVSNIEESIKNLKIDDFFN